MEWEILMTTQVEEFSMRSSGRTLTLTAWSTRRSWCWRRSGPSQGRPLVDGITASQITNMKELRPPSAGTTEIRILFVFDPWRSAILLVAGDKSGQWSRWYRQAIPEVEQLYATYLKEREKEIGDER